MISWLQNLLLKRGKVIFGTLLVVIITAFVLTFTPAGGGAIGPSERSNQFGFFGYNLNSSRDTRQLQLRAEMSMMLNFPEQQITSEQLNNALLSRIALIHMADELHIPYPNEEDVTGLVSKAPRFLGADGNFDADAYTAFLDTLEANPLLDEQLLRAAIEEDYRIERVNSALGGPGYAADYEAVRQTQLRETAWTVNVAKLDLSGFEPEIEITDEEKQAYYTNNSFRYEVPEEVRVSVVKFQQDSFLDQVGEPAEENILAYFAANKSRFVKPAETPGEEPAEPKLEEHREEIVLELKREAATEVAVGVADEFSYALYDQNVAKDSEAFTELVAKHKGEVIEVPAFNQQRPPFQAGIGPREYLQAFALKDSTRYFSDIIRARDGGAVLIYEESIPGRLPALEEVAGRVEADLKKQKQADAREEHAKAKREAVAAALAAGEDFDTAAKANGLTVESFESFTAMKMPEGFDRSLYSLFGELELGEVSEARVRGNDLSFVHLADKSIPAADKSSGAHVEQLEMAAMRNRFSGAQAFVMEVTMREIERVSPPAPEEE